MGGPRKASWKFQWYRCAEEITKARIVHAWTINKRSMVRTRVGLFITRLHILKELFNLHLFIIFIFSWRKSIGIMFYLLCSLRSNKLSYTDPHTFFMVFIYRFPLEEFCLWIFDRFDIEYCGQLWEYHKIFLSWSRFTLGEISQNRFQYDEILWNRFQFGEISWKKLCKTLRNGLKM